MVERLHSDLAYSFLLPKELRIDPALRTAADKISADHLIRMRQLLPGWVQEETAIQAAEIGKANRNAVFYAVWARILNELALWQIAPGDAEYEKATLEVLRSSPLICLTAGNPRFHDFISRVMRLQWMPPAQQQAGLAMERQLLERWGTATPAAQPWPNPLPQDAGMRAVAQIQSGGPRPPLALSPLLAHGLLAKRKGYNDLSWAEKCAFQQWWLRVSLAQGSAPAAVLSAFRYGTMITAKDRLKGIAEFDNGDAPKASAQGIPPYPKLAARFGVSGMTQVARQLDASGRIQHATVSRRELTVPGVRGVRPVAFENTFDDLTVHYGFGAGNSGKPDPAAPKEVQLMWQLEAPTAADAKTDTRSQGETP